MHFLNRVSIPSFCLCFCFCVLSPLFTLCHAYENVQVNGYPNPEETSIAINPTNPDHIIGVAQVPCRYYISEDCGASWENGLLDDPFELGDPTIAFDHLGNAYYCYIGTFYHSGIFINRSLDGGHTWSAQPPAVIEHDSGAPFEDKSYLHVDQTHSPYRGNIYVAWTQFDHYQGSAPSDSTRILFSRSDDMALTFSEPVRVSDKGGNCLDNDDTVEGAVPSVGPDGTVYLAWSGPRGIEFDLSTDGGLTFGIDKVISDQPGGWDFGVPDLDRCNGFPITKVDISQSPFSGRIYVCWSDQRFGDTDVFLISSDDRGDSWSPRVRINTDTLSNGRDQFFPWMDVDPVTGIIYVVFYDRREHADNRQTDVYLATSIDGGVTFTDEKISDSPFQIDPSAFFGDYIGLAAYAGHVRPLWVRMDGAELSLWTALIDFHSTDVEFDLPEIGHLRISPNPVHSTTRIYNAELISGATNLTMFDAAGRVVRQIKGRTAGDNQWVEWDSRDDEGHLVPSGVYFLGAEFSHSARIMVIR